MKLEPKHGTIDIEKHQLFTLIILTGWLFLIIYSAVYIYLAAYLSAAVCLFSAVVLVPMCYILDRNRKFLASRFLCILSAVFMITLSSIGVSNKVNSEYYYLPTMMLSLLLFDPHQKKAMAMCIFIPLFAWLSMDWIPVPEALQSWIPGQFPYKDFSVLNFIGAFGITYIFLDLYAKSFKRLTLIALENEHKLMQSAKMASLGELAGGIAHEINNPLSIIIGRTQILKQKLEDAKIGEIDPGACMQNLEKIEDTAALIAKIVKGLSSFSRKSDQDPMTKTSFNKIIEYTLELCQERFKNESIKLRVSFNADVEVQCRDSQIAQVLMNLISNALDAIQHLPEKWIDISVSASKTQVKFAITDSGKGIPPNVVEKIMQPFFSTKEAGKGIGLGLSISKGIVEEHNGTLKYDDSSLNTRFVLTLPVAT
jgi:signal transduction histidine kinase